jgi:hypothetical protein
MGQVHIESLFAKMHRDLHTVATVKAVACSMEPACTWMLLVKSALVLDRVHASTPPPHAKYTMASFAKIRCPAYSVVAGAS